MTRAPTAETLARLAAVVGEKHALTTAADMARYLTEWRGLWQGKAAMVLRPGSTKEVARLLAIAHETETAIVPQGGNTGLVGGQIPSASGHEVVISLERMNRIAEVDADNLTLMAEAGCTLSALQDAAEQAGLLFPLSLAAEGSCQIGGNLSSNAGGLNMLAYGNARDLCLGLEVVLADGRVWNGLGRLRKDNTGYDLKNLFIGAEGTLGIITRCVLKLYPRPRTHETGFAAVASVAAAVKLLALARALSGNRVVGFELMNHHAVDFAHRHMGQRLPLAAVPVWSVLVELADPAPGALMAIMEQALEQDLVVDAVVAQSEAQRAEMWGLREAISEAQKFEGGSIKHDVSVPVSHIPAFLDEAMAAVERVVPGARPVPFGHMGDGNIHFNISQPKGADTGLFLARWGMVSEAVFMVVLAHGGSISAEHGIGVLKREDMRLIKSPVALDMMRAIKTLLDPRGIMNPGKVLPAP